MNKKVIKEILSYVVVIVVALLIKEFVFTLIIVNGDSMNPTLKTNEYGYANKTKLAINNIYFYIFPGRISTHRYFLL